MFPDPIDDHAAIDADRILEQYKIDPLLVAAVAADSRQGQAVEDALNGITAIRNLDNAEGVVLDRFGALLGQARESRTDDEYRARIRLRIIQLQSQGTCEELIKIFKTLANSESVQIQEFYPADFVLLTAVGADPVLADSDIADAIQHAKPAGVGHVEAVLAGNPFVFAGDPDGAGFGDLDDPEAGGEFSSLL